MVEKLKKNLIPLAIVIAGLLIAGAIIYINQGKVEKISGLLSPQQAAEKAINFINQNLLEGTTASLINVIEESGIFKFRFNIGEEEYDFYVTKNGKLLFIRGIEMIEEEPIVQESEVLNEGKVSADDKLEILAKCLSEKGAKFYGTYWCGWCNKQKEIFGQAAQYLPYIECSDPESRELTSQCQTAGITGFPTWEFNGKKIPGFKTPEELTELSGCHL